MICTPASRVQVGQATTAERKRDIALRAHDLLAGPRPGRLHGFVPASDIVYDLCVLAVGTGLAEHASLGVAFIEGARMLRSASPSFEAQLSTPLPLPPSASPPLSFPACTRQLFEGRYAQCTRNPHCHSCHEQASWMVES